MDGPLDHISASNAPIFNPKKPLEHGDVLYNLDAPPKGLI